MRRLLGPLVLLLVLAGCGDEPGEPTRGEPAPPEPTPSETTRAPEPDPTTAGADDVAHTVVALVHETAVGGMTQDVASPVGPGEGASTGEFLGQFEDQGFRELVEQQIVFARAQGDLYAAVVEVGCDVPPGVTVTEVDGGYAITGQKIVTPTPECFAPVTTVAVVAVRD